ncbi:protein kinase [Scytonema sp. UIC 10036]|uniref:protein kinase domain-containing protein n=1 Tax=Scytonema sp. UIC 10036 TaxID=2304196 RepID=UPI0012DA128C|nr:protein kinase [Scytonema sp. UIC 10036]MUG91599.1 protein kinase [Scytonema sp. UIC 10036]
MTCCVNPNCQNPENPLTGNYCINCGTRLCSLKHYRPIKLLGKGGFGRTFLAVDESSSSQTKYAIKQLSFLENYNEQTSQRIVELFHREGRHLKSLGNHSQIPALLDLFEHEQQLFQVQEYIEGTTLEDELQEQGVYNEVKIRQLLQDLLPVLQFIHQHGVIHRDIKPSNIIRSLSEPC